MKTRRILYTICFTLLCVVDWVNGSQDGRLQFVATNLIGVLMGIVILSTYRFKEFLKPAYYVWAAVSVIAPTKNRYKTLIAIGFLAFFISICLPSKAQ